MGALAAVKALELPDCLIAAGFIRNLVWDSLYDQSSVLNDIDVVYFCPLDTSETKDVALEKRLRALQPSLPWSVKNQARMHLGNGDKPYKSTLDAMAFWPEKQTAIGARIEDDDSLIVQSVFDLELQFNGEINHNPARSIETFNQRVSSKGWLDTWPLLPVVS